MGGQVTILHDTVKLVSCALSGPDWRSGRQGVLPKHETHEEISGVAVMAWRPVVALTMCPPHRRERKVSHGQDQD